MRILILSERYPPHVLGGYEIACHAVASRLGARGHQVEVLTGTFGVGHRTSAAGIHRELHQPAEATTLLRLLQWEREDRRAWTRILASFRPDVVYAWALLNLFPALHRELKRSAVPVVLNIQDSWLPRHAQLSTELAKAWTQSSHPLGASLKRAARGTLDRLGGDALRPISIGDMRLDNVVFCSRFRRDEHAQLGLPAGRSWVIYNGIDVETFPETPREPHERVLKMLFVGRLVSEKGAHVAIDALAELHAQGHDAVTLTIAGVPSFPWSYAEDLAQSVRDRQLAGHVHFLGQVAHTALPALYRDHDVLIFPSLLPEGFPVTLLEAMSCGLAVVASPTGGTGELVESGVNGLAFAPGQVAELVHSLRSLIETPSLRQRLGRTAAAHVREHFTLDTIALQTETCLGAVAR